MGERVERGVGVLVRGTVERCFGVNQLAAGVRQRVERRAADKARKGWRELRRQTVLARGTVERGVRLGSSRGAGNCGEESGFDVGKQHRHEGWWSRLGLQAICWKGWRESGVDVSKQPWRERGRRVSVVQQTRCGKWGREWRRRIGKQPWREGLWREALALGISRGAGKGGGRIAVTLVNSLGAREDGEALDSRQGAGKGEGEGRRR